MNLAADLRGRGGSGSCRPYWDGGVVLPPRKMRTYRKEKVASVIRGVLGEAILHRLHDPRIAPLTTLIRVQVSDDLLIARLYLSVPGGETAERLTLTALRSARGFLQRQLTEHLQLRHCPELRFEIDVAAKGVRSMMDLLAENRRREPELYESEEEDPEIESEGPDLDEPADPATNESPGAGE